MASTIIDVAGDLRQILARDVIGAAEGFERSWEGYFS
jgi:hypothetical protein